MPALKIFFFFFLICLSLFFFHFFSKKEKNEEMFYRPTHVMSKHPNVLRKQEWPWGQRFPADVGGTGSAIRQRRITFPFGTSQPRLWIMMVCAILKMLRRSNLIHYECQWLGTTPSRRPAITITQHWEICFHNKADFILLLIMEINIRT